MVTRDKKFRFFVLGVCRLYIVQQHTFRVAWVNRLIRSSSFRVKLRLVLDGIEPYVPEGSPVYRGIGWWLVLLVNYAVIGNSSNVRLS